MRRRRAWKALETRRPLVRTGNVRLALNPNERPGPAHPDASLRLSFRRMLEYDRICDWYAKARSPHIGVPDVTALTQRLAPGSKILDLGCGNGVPISRALIQSGFAVFGVDSSKEMITRFTEHCPNAPAECATIQGSEFFHTVLDAAVAWGVLFHLAPADQELAISRVARVLKQDGMFLFTAGAEEGTERVR